MLTSMTGGFTLEAVVRSGLVSCKMKMLRMSRSLLSVEFKE